MQRRHFLRLAAGTGAALGLGAGFGTVPALRRFARPPVPDESLSSAARAVLAEVWKGLDPSQLLDVHAHVVGLGTGGTGCFASERMQDSFGHPLRWAQFRIYCEAAGLTELADADQRYVRVLLERIRSQPAHGRHVVLAFDRVHRADGTPDDAATELHTPNDHVLALSKSAPDCFVPGASIHPYRKDAVDELERVVARGAVLVKWLPNAMGIDPGSPACDAFYDALARLKVPLLTHAGEERAVHSDAQSFGHPLLLRRPLERGVKVIVAHCASLGESVDLDAANRPLVRDFDLFLRLADEAPDQLYGDISALTQSNRAHVLPDLLRRQDLHARLLYGTDYPLTAIDGLIRTTLLVELGLVTEAERETLNEIDRHNPLAFDLAAKRLLRLTEGGRELRFSDTIFGAHPDVLPRLG